MMKCLIPVKGICMEVSIIGLTLLLFTLTARANEQGVTLATDFMSLVNDGLWIAVLLSVFGGGVGLIGRLRDAAWMQEAKKSGVMLSVVGELTFSVFTGVLILIYGKSTGLTNLTILSSILAGSWLGTKAGRLAMVYIRSNRDKIASMIAGGKNDPRL